MNNFTAINEPGPNQVLQKKNEQEMSKKVFIYIYLKFDCLYKKSENGWNDQRQIFATTHKTSIKVYATSKMKNFPRTKNVDTYYFWKYTKLNTSSYNILNSEMSWFLRIFTFCWIRIGLAWNSKLNIQLIFWLIFNIVYPCIYTDPPVLMGNMRSPYPSSRPDSPISSPQSRSHSPTSRSRSRSPCSAGSRSPGSPQSQASEVSRQESCHSRQSRQSRISRATGKTSRSRSASPSTPRLANNCISPPLYPRNFQFSGPEPPRPFPDGRYPHW